MTKMSDLAGKTFGKVSVIEPFDRTDKGEVRWLCRCSCGKQSVHRGSNLRSGRVNSCGCMQIKALKARIKRMEDLREKPFLDAKSKMEA
ncbi:MAG: hypothetical protein CVU73_11020 [Deltaproteobacteria bacterium HGW-Deltaproteobacteria-8]|jgi:hypothetical protein|nr:MAG: hypothetical protein CVU73_11020 [Deltaproteobacteria bacterium HGW-Deltaproteobacteria-8]